MPEVSVVIPTYNRPQFLKRAIGSVLRQTFADFEIIVVDDGSAVPAKPVIDDFGDPRLHYVYQQNCGLSASRNRGIQEAQGTLIALLDDDDMFMPHKLESQVHYLRDNPRTDVALGGYRVVDPEGKVLSEQRPWIHHDPNDIRTWLFGCPAVPSAMLARRQCLDEVGGFDTDLWTAEEIDLWTRLCLQGYSMAFVQDIVCCYTVHSGALTRNLARNREGHLRQVAKLRSFAATHAELRALLPQAEAHAYLVEALRACTAGEYAAAQRDMVAALATDPSLTCDPERFIRAVRNQAINPSLPDPLGFAQSVFAHLPPEAACFAGLRRRTLGQVARYLAFSAHRMGAPKKARTYLLNAVLCDPPSMLDRGFWSVAAEALLGRRVAKLIRGLV